jgi:hypothetical protein
MAKWIVKAALQRTISVLPGRQSVNYAFQKHITKSLDFDAIWFQRRLRECRWHLENYLNTTAHPNARIVELGTGWYPTIPVSFWLCGANKIYTFDIQPVLRIEALQNTFHSFIASADRGELREALPWVKEDRLAVLRHLIGKQGKPATILMDLGIEALIRDARNTGLESGTVDFLYSNSVLHEIPEHILISIFSEFKRLASTNGVMSHYIVMKDLYSLFDSSITQFNFLKYSDWTWSLLNNPLQYHNRLRVADYRRIHHSSGFTPLYEHDERGSPADLEKVRLAPKFMHYNTDDLLVTRAWIVSSVNPAAFAENTFSPGWIVLRHTYKR